MTRLSVVVTAHDVAAFLPTTLAAVERNAAPDVEGIFVDDGSKDGTTAILEAFRVSEGRSVVLRNRLALGVAAARNLGAEHATGRDITFLDADDWIGAGHLDRMTREIERLGVDFVRTDHVRAEGRKRALVRAPETRRWRRIPAREGIDPRPDRMSMVDYPFAWAAVYDARLRDRGLLTVDPALHTAEDRYMTWRLHLQADSFAVVGLPGYFYRREVAGSLTAIGDDRQLHFFDALDRVGELVLEPDAEAFRAKFVRAYFALIAFHEPISLQSKLAGTTARRPARSMMA